MKNRIAFIFLFVSICWSLLFLRGMYLQVWTQPRLTDLKNRLFETTIEISARRGMILDRNGKELAVAMSGYSLFADPHLLKSQRKVITNRLAKLLKISKSEIAERLKNTERRFVWLKRGLPEPTKTTIESWKIRGLGFIEEPRRVYPQDQLAGQMLGFVGVEGQGLEGLERQWDSKLKGQSRKLMLPKDARGRPLLPDGKMLTDIPDGQDLTLTLDSELQYILESELEAAVQTQNAESAVGVVLDAKTSEILAMAHVPLLHLNHALKAPGDSRRARAITDTFEPGSTIKPFVIAAGLEEKRFKPNRRIDCGNGRLEVGDKFITEAEKGRGFGILTVGEILAFSSNVGMAKIAMELGDQTVRRYLERFGFGHTSGIDFPGESKGILQPLPWRPHLLSNISFGHGIAVTPIQMAQAYASIANGGFLRRPTLVRSVRNNESGEVQDLDTDPGVRIMTPQTASLLKLMLMAATTGQGTGANARIPGYPVAGKTGTAQKVDAQNGGYMKNAYISSFAGFVPASDPQFVIYIAVDNPRKSYYGSQVAAPLFAKVSQFAVRQRGLSPILIENRHLITEDIHEESQPLASITQAETPQGAVPQLLGLSLREVYQRVHGVPMTLDIRGTGVVVRTHPEAGVSLPPSARVQLFLQPVDGNREIR